MAMSMEKYLIRVNGKGVPVYATHSALEECKWLTSQPGLCTPRERTPVGLRVVPEVGVDISEKKKTSPPQELNPRLSSL